MEINRPFILQSLTELVRIPSVNPSLSAEGTGEGAIAEYVASRMAALGLEVKIVAPQPGRASVLAVLPGTGGGKSLMLNGHLDTVGVDGMEDPFSARVDGGNLYGRGAFDMKGSLAACMGAVEAVQASGTRLTGDLVLAAVADEEYGSLGTSAILEMTRTDAAIVTEPTALAVCLAHKGYVWLEVEVLGRAAHGSRFELGRDANLLMGRFLGALALLEQDLRTRPAHPLVGPPSLHAALLQGGAGLSTYAARATVKIERRTVPGETEAQVIQEIQTLLDRLTAEDSDFHATVKSFFVRNPFEVSREGTVVQALAKASENVLRKPARYMGDTPWMDAALLHSAGVETVVCGPAGGGAHADVEWVELESVYRLAEVLADTAMIFCQT